jgi:ribosomal protein S8
MIVRTIIHVTYNYDEDRWRVIDTTKQPSKILRRSHTKAAALRYATTKARSRRHIGQVVVHTKDGKIEHEMTFGCDPVESEG